MKILNKRTILPLTLAAIANFEATGAVLADFDGNDAVYAIDSVKTPAFNANQILTDGPSGSYLHLLDGGEGDAGNYISFDSVTPTNGWTAASFKMDFRTDLVAADGFSVAFLDSEIHGETGVVRAGSTALDGVEERGLYSNSIGVGFRTFNGTNATVNYNGAQGIDSQYVLPDAGTWGSMEITMDRDANGTVALEAVVYSEPGQQGTAFPVFTEAQTLENVTLEDFRLQIAGRTGGSSMTLDIDNIELNVSAGDSDGDGLADRWEEKYGLSASDDGSVDVNNGPDGDPDVDGLSNLEEQSLGTDPQSDDTDDDGLSDAVEDGGGEFISITQTGTDPLNADTDGDGLSDGVENPLLDFVDANQPGTDPNNADTDGDFLGDSVEILDGRDPTVPEDLDPIAGVLLADFDNPQVPYDAQGVRTAGFLAQQVVDDGPTGSYYHLLDGGEGDAGNYLSFDAPSDATGWKTAQFSMDYRADRVAADGWHIAFLDIPTHGDTGVVRAGSNGFADAEERGLFSNSIGVGFRTFNGTNATVNYNGQQSADIEYEQQQGSWGSVEVVLQKSSDGNVLLDATIYPEIGLLGVGQNVVSNYLMEGVALEQFRMQIGGRTGGSSMDLDVDNLVLNVFRAGEGDNDGDGLADLWENKFDLSTDDDGSIDPNNGPNGDPDGDGLTNLEENALGTSPIDDDSDGDGYKDAVEDGGGTFVSLSKTGTSPLNPDTDDDGLLDGVENPLVDFVDADQPGTDPNNPDSDDDGFKDGIEIATGNDPTSGDTITVGGDGVIADFDLSGEKYAEEALRNAPIVGLQAPEGDSDGNFYQLLETVGSAGNYISFESSEDYTGWESFSFQMDYLSTEMQADGFGINFLDTEVHGDSGAVKVLSEEENALIDNSFGVGFKTFQSTEASITWNGIDVSGRLPFTLTNDKWASIGIDVDRDPITKTALVDVTVYDAPDRQGIAENVYTDFEVEGMTLEDFRVQLEGRTGGSAMNFSIDNLKLIVDGSGGGNSGIVINSVTREVVNGSVSVTITWNSREGQTYSVLASEDLALGDLTLWDELDDGVQATVGADVTSFTESGLPLDTKTRFYIVRIPE